MAEELNPYQPPAAMGVEEGLHVPPWRENQYYLIWIWSCVATLGATAITPAVPMISFLAMNCALVAFLLGAGLAAVQGKTVATLIAKVLLLPFGCFGLTVCLVLLQINGAIALAFPVFNALLGALSMVGVVHHRRRIYLSIAVAFPLGSLLGAFFALLFTWAAVYFCGRNVKRDA